MLDLPPPLRHARLVEQDPAPVVTHRPTGAPLDELEADEAGGLGEVLVPPLRRWGVVPCNAVLVDDLCSGPGHNTGPFRAISRISAAVRYWRCESFRASLAFSR